MKRIYHTWDKWECYPAGFYDANAPKGFSENECEERYREFLSDIPRFKAAMERVISEWPNSCEHYLSNQNMNRVAWLGQSSACIDMRIPRRFRSGYNLLSEEGKRLADEAALEYLNKWLSSRGEDRLDSNGAKSKTQAELY